MSLEAIEVGCLSVGNPQRTERMQARFNQAFIPHHLFISFDYPAHLEKILKEAPNAHALRAYSCMTNHLLILKHYYERGLEEIVVCENDVHLSKHFSEEMLYTLLQMRRFHYDIVLLGCLLPNVPGRPGFYGYDEELWGAQGYVVSRSYAKRLLDLYIYNDRWRPSQESDFAADWTITKLAPDIKRAFVYPQLMVEEGQSGDNDDAHAQFHRRCHDLHFSSLFYL